MYDGYAYSSSGPTFSGINIGAAVYDNNTEVKVNANSKAHIVGEYSPMYGSLTNHPAGLKPNIEMAHIAAVVGIKVVNNTVDDITVKNIKMVTNLPIVGHFSLDATKIDKDGKLLTDAFTPISGQSTNTVTITLASPVKIPNNGQSATIYFPARPFATKLKDIAIYINGSEKIPVSESVATFSSGRVTTLKVEVNPFSSPVESDGFNLTFIDRKDKKTKKVLSLFELTDGEYNSITEPTNVVTINNTSVPIYVLGNNTTHILRIEGGGSDIVNVLPITFYASRWNNLPTAMRLKSVDVYWKALISRDWLSSGTFSKLDGLLGIELDDGITLDDLVALGFNTSRMTFSGMIPNCDFSDEVVMIDEERTSKILDNASGGNIETYLKMAGDAATIQGLINIFNGDLNSDSAKATGKALYDFIYAKVSKKAGKVADIAMGVIGVSSATGLMERLRDAQFLVEVETCPYPGTNTQNPIVFWGIDKSEK